MMYYNLNRKTISLSLPQNILKEDGSLFVDFNLSTDDILSDYGYYVLRSDNNVPPTPTSIEIEASKEIIVDRPYVDIVRKWLEVKTVASITIQQQKIVENIPDDDMLN